MTAEWKHKIFDGKKGDFNDLALDVFGFQYHHNPVYRAYTDALGIKPELVTKVGQIPFLPIGFFKTHVVKTTDFEPEKVFESSGTTGMVNSLHYVKSTGLYEESFTRGFEAVYGPVTDWCIIGLLPSYLERSGSSLVYMTDRLIQRSRHPESGFYLYEYDKLFDILTILEAQQQPTLVIGVTFALLDFAEKYRLPLKYTILMETGGMKGRRKEMVRPEVHAAIQLSFGPAPIHSEYGMTEMLSQAYSKGEGVFHCPPWMKVLLRDDEDPLQVRSFGSGVINVIDLANIYSCSFIATDDVGKLYPDGSFEVLGRIDGSDMRGCGLMVV
ncbi:MAG: acyl transferase [Chitinophagaceae bacterium]|nr:acyl transferase [Chitinophagaceae bacterium]